MGSKIFNTPGKRIGLFTTLTVLPVSVAIGTFSLLPTDIERQLRQSQTLIETPLPNPALAGQLDAFTPNLSTSVRTTELHKTDTVYSAFSRLDIDDKEALRFIRQQPLAQPLMFPRDNIFLQAIVYSDHKLQSLKIFAEKTDDTQGNRLITIEKRKGVFTVREDTYRYDIQQDMATGVVKTTLQDAAAEQAIPEKIVEQMPMIFEKYLAEGNVFEVGDTFKVIYEQFYLNGHFVRTGKILAMALNHKGKTIESFWADDGTRDGNYYALDGISTRIPFIRIPVDNARVTSSFMALRRHPVTGVLRPHKGTDFGSPRGSKIYAAADGEVIKRAYNPNGYGNYVVIQHDQNRSSLYGHMSKISHRINPGVTVKKGEVIGYVGSTGLATGPHLHYELMLNNNQINPLKVPYPERNELSNAELERLLTRARKLTAQLALLDKIQTAQPAAQNAITIVPFTPN